MTETGKGVRWLFPPQADVSALPPDAPPLVARILAGRDIDTKEKLRRFLNPSHLPYDPNLLPGMGAAVERLRRAVSHGERVGVFGDFDVDGTTGTAILCEGLAGLGAIPIPYLPNRADEGHGLSASAIDSLVRQGATLIVTVDCGITDSAEVAYAAGQGADVIITDHHLPPGSLPDAVACVNARLPGSEYPFPELCGAALAFKVIEGLHLSWDVPYDPALLELAALGTIADLVPLLDENRYLASAGIEELRHTGRPGLQALFANSNIQDDLSSETVGFQIAPRLNAAGRLGSAMDSYRLLTTKSEQEAVELAEKLENLNRQRREITEATANLVVERVEAMSPLPYFLLVADEAIQQGVAGLAAARLTERYCRPAAALSINGGYAVASVRSIPEFNVVEAIADSSHLLTRYGGHAQAAGFTVPTDCIGQVEERLNAYAAQRLSSLDLSPTLEINAVARLPELDGRVYEWLSLLEPFGKGNSRPVFASLNVSVLEARAVGRNGQHLSLRVEQDGRAMKAIAFNQAAAWRSAGLQAGSRLDLAYTLMENVWYDNVSLELRVSQFRPAEARPRLL